MPIDANLLLHSDYSAPMTLANLTDPNRLNQIQQGYQQNQLGNIQLQQAKQDQADAMTLRDIFQNQSDPNARLQAMQQGGLVKPYMAQQKFDLDTNNTRAEIGHLGAQTVESVAKAGKEQVQTQLEQLDYVGRMFSGIKDLPTPEAKEAAYQTAKADVAAKYPERAAQMAPNYNEMQVTGNLAKALAVKDQLAQHLKEMDIAAENSRSDASIQAANSRNSATIAGENSRAFAGQANARLIAGIGADGKPLATDQATLTMDAQRYLTDGTLPPNMGRGQQGYMHAQQIRQEAAKIADANGTDIAGLRAQQISNKAALTKEGQLAGATDTTIRKFNVAISHLDTLGQLADALNNGDTQVINKLRNAYNAQTGKPAPTNFTAAKGIIANEIVSAVVAGGGALGDRKDAESTLNAANSPEQLHDVIKTYQTLMGGQLGGIRQQRDSVLGAGSTDKKLSQRAQQVIGGQSTSGNSVQTPDGQVHTFPTPEAAAAFKKAAGL